MNSKQNRSIRHPRAKSLNNLTTLDSSILSVFSCGPPASSPPAPRREPFTSPILLSRQWMIQSCSKDMLIWFDMCCLQVSCHVDMRHLRVLTDFGIFWQGRGPPETFSVYLPDFPTTRRNQPWALKQLLAFHPVGGKQWRLEFKGCWEQRLPRLVQRCRVSPFAFWLFCTWRNFCMMILSWALVLSQKAQYGAVFPGKLPWCPVESWPTGRVLASFSSYILSLDASVRSRFTCNRINSKPELKTTYIDNWSDASQSVSESLSKQWGSSIVFSHCFYDLSAVETKHAAHRCFSSFLPTST